MTLAGAVLFADDFKCGTFTEAKSMQSIECNKAARIIKVQMPDVMPARGTAASSCRGLCNLYAPIPIVHHSAAI